MILNEKFKQTFLGLILAVAIYIAFAFSTIAHGRTVFWIMHILLAMAVCVLAGLFYKKAEERLKTQIRFIFRLMLPVSLLALVSSVIGFGGKGSEEAVLYEMISQLIFAVFFCYMMKKDHEESGDFFSGIRSCLLKNKWLLLLLLLGAVLSYDPIMFVFKYDGTLYYEAADAASMYSLSSLAYYGHMSQGAALIITFFVKLLAGNTGAGIYLANVTVMCVGGLAFYGILKKIVPERTDSLYVLLTAIYIFSPYVLGMSSYLSMDFYCTCLFLPVIYFTVSEQWLLQVVCGALFACTKEPGIVIYGAICLCVLLQDFKKTKWKVFTHSRYYGMAMVAALWLATLMVIGIWNAGDSRVGSDLGYALRKLSVLYVLNFTWIFVPIILLGFGAMMFCFKKEAKQIWGKILPIVFSMVAFTAFSIVINTVNHARYSDISPVCVYLLGAIVIAFYAEKVKNLWTYGVAAVLSVIMLLSTFFTIDPLSTAIFEKLKTDNGYLLSTVSAGFYMGDHMLYNRQGLYLENAYGAMIEDALSENDIIVIPAYSAPGLGGSTYYFDGLIGPVYLSNQGYEKCTQHWDTKKRRRLNMIEKSDISYDVYSVADMEGLYELKKLAGDDARYIYAWVEGIEDNISKDIEKEYAVLDRKTYKYRGWTINGIVF